MKQWEYKVLPLSQYATQQQEELNSLGGNRWELVAIIPDRHSDTHGPRAYLKREVDRACL